VKIFEMSYPGMALGGVIVVTAANEALARDAAFRHLQQEAVIGRHLQPVTADDIKLDKTSDFTPYSTTVVYNWNGDY
jgi:hypothetical protein